MARFVMRRLVGLTPQTQPGVWPAPGQIPPWGCLREVIVIVLLACSPLCAACPALIIMWEPVKLWCMTMWNPRCATCIGGTWWSGAGHNLMWGKLSFQSQSTDSLVRDCHSILHPVMPVPKTVCLSRGLSSYFETYHSSLRVQILFPGGYHSTLRAVIPVSQ